MLDDPAYETGDIRSKLLNRIRLADDVALLGALTASVCVLRTAWLNGIHGKNFVKAILDGAGRGRRLHVVADQMGSPTSSIDLARAVDRLIRTPARGLFHVANAGACSRFEFAKAIVEGPWKCVLSPAAIRPGLPGGRPTAH